MNNNEIKTINFQKVSFLDLKSVVPIKKKSNDAKFDNWFNFKYKLSDSEKELFNELITENKLYLSGYNEAKLFACFIAPLLYKVKFHFNDIKDWYESYLTGTVNGCEFNGKTDFMVAKGDFVPEKPYFFIQEYKRSFPTNNPEFQLLAEMLVAIEINKTNILHGGFVVGKLWHFLILEKLKNNSYEYFVSDSFDCLKIDQLQQIYINLQAAKTLFCKD